MKIAIGITTTPNRSDIANYNLKKWQDLLPENAVIFINCDTEYKGISIAKNEVLKHCYESGAEHLFICDDDIFPKQLGWELPYINSGLNHACWNYDRQVIDNSNNAYDVLITPNGCMLYLTRQTIDKVGGWDTEFQGWSYEHVNLSDRVFNNGLTPARYIDVANTKGLFELSECASSVSDSVKCLSIPINHSLYQQKFYSKEFKHFK